MMGCLIYYNEWIMNWVFLIVFHFYLTQPRPFEKRVLAATDSIGINLKQQTLHIYDPIVV